MAEVATRKDQPVWGIPCQLVEELNHHSFLAFDSPGVDRVEQVEAKIGGSLAYQIHRSIKVAVHGHDMGPIGHRLGQLSTGHPPGRDEDDT